MLNQPMDVLEQFPVRKSKKQKQAFRDAVQSYAEALGYEVTVEKGSMGSRNVIIGNPESAEYLVTAHYDTCAHMPIPNFITPCNFIVYLIYQLLIVAVLFIVAGAVTALVSLTTHDGALAMNAGLLMYWVMLLLMMVGPANKHNANDNTSGVVTVLEIARTLSENHREKVCFVLFDLEEAGLLGSASYRSKHKKATNQQLVLNLDCIGDGDEIVMFLTSKLRRDKKKMGSLDSIARACGEKKLYLHKKGFAFCPSDQANFPKGVGIMAFHRKKILGLYCSRIHTHRDTILEEENVNILRDQLTALITAD